MCRRGLRGLPVAIRKTVRRAAVLAIRLTQRLRSKNARSGLQATKSPMFHTGFGVQS